MIFSGMHLIVEGEPSPVAVHALSRTEIGIREIREDVENELVKEQCIEGPFGRGDVVLIVCRDMNTLRRR